MAAEPRPPALHDDDVLDGLLMAAAAPTRGAHHPGAGTDVYVDVARQGAEAAMVAHHEAAHLALNYMTSYGLVLRAMGADAALPTPPPGLRPRLAAMVGLCRRTHEVFATTSGVWRAPGLFDDALREYPSYQEHLDAGRALAGSLREGSFAAHTAVECACWAAMQAPLGDLLQHHGVEQLTAELVPAEMRPDVRLQVLLDAALDPAFLDVAVPVAWRNGLIRDGGIAIDDLHATFTVVASSYYHAFAAVLVDVGLPTFAFDGHKTDPTILQWLEAHPATVAEPIHYRPSEEGIDRFWAVTVSDAERVVISTGRPLVVVPFADLPATGDERTLGRDFFVAGGEDESSVLVIVRPLRTLLQQYRVDDDGAALLWASATDGVVTAVRAETQRSDGQVVTVLGVLSSRAQVDALAALPTAHGLLASVSDTCNWFPAWSNYWSPALMASAYAVRLADFPRRLWIDGLEQEGQAPRVQPFTVGTDASVPGGLGGLAVYFGSGDVPADPPFLVLGTARTVNAVASALDAVFGAGTVGRVGLPSPEAKFLAIVQRLVAAEPWFDARGLEDLPDFAKMGERFQEAGRIARRG